MAGSVRYRAGGRLYVVPNITQIQCGVDEIAVRDSGGSRDALVLIHGWGVDSLINYGVVIESLEGAFRVVAIDLPGHGASSGRTPFTLERGAETVWQVCDALGIDACILVGYSMGGPVSQIAAMRAPMRVRGMVQVATGARLRASTALPAALAGASKVTGRVARAIPQRGAPQQHCASGEYQRIAEVALRANIAALAESFSESVSYDGRSRIADFSVPAASIVTVRDRVVPLTVQTELVELLNAVRIDVHDGHDLCRRPHFAELLVRAIEALRYQQGVGLGHCLVTQ